MYWSRFELRTHVKLELLVRDRLLRKLSNGEGSCSKLCGSFTKFSQLLNIPMLGVGVAGSLDVKNPAS